MITGKIKIHEESAGIVTVNFDLQADIGTVTEKEGKAADVVGEAISQAMQFMAQESGGGSVMSGHNLGDGVIEKFLEKEVAVAKEKLKVPGRETKPPSNTP